MTLSSRLFSDGDQRRGCGFSDAQRHGGGAGARDGASVDVAVAATGAVKRILCGHAGSMLFTIIRAAAAVKRIMVYYEPYEEAISSDPGRAAPSTCCCCRWPRHSTCLRLPMWLAATPGAQDPARPGHPAAHGGRARRRATHVGVVSLCAAAHQWQARALSGASPSLRCASSWAKCCACCSRCCTAPTWAHTLHFHFVDEHC